MHEEELVNRLCKLGLTNKQARIYLSVVISGATNVASIARKTGIHKQDIYKILPKLEKLGLLTRKFIKPVQVESIPIEEAITNLIKKQQELLDARERIAKEVIETLREKQATLPAIEEGRIMILPGNSDALKNRTKRLFENLRKAYDVFTTKEHLIKILPRLSAKFFETLATHRVPIRILISMHEEDEDFVDFIKSLKIPPVNVTIKSIRDSGSLHFGIVDNEVWIPFEALPDSAVIITDIKCIIDICKEHFEKMWHNPSTRILFQQT
ncbi:MAG: helix-turn-helix domain-containing protein [Candidatus Bathyarchaeia archaeon]